MGRRWKGKGGGEGRRGGGAAPQLSGVSCSHVPPPPPLALQAALPPPTSTALPPGGTDPLREVILLAACAATEVLPQNPDLPADVFTACLTTPIKVGVEGVEVWGGKVWMAKVSRGQSSSFCDRPAASAPLFSRCASEPLPPSPPLR